jgi:alkanesulfonate monooxygenase SsuD/methylene tetrahydromethanopterin reductase-like flavin-dependent oxidoreductase (luciferase family)
MEASMNIGVLLPHFGPHSSFERLVEFTPRLEAMGFASVWVRDNLGFTGGHGFEDRGSTFVDPFVTLTAIANRTTTLTLGTATIIPIRPHAITAQLVGSLCYMAPGRVILGVGAGNVPKAFALSGMPFDQRYDLARDMVGVIRALSEPDASYSGPTVSFEHATVEPAAPGDLPIWYGGSTNQSVDRAIEYADGWMPGRCPMAVFDEKLARLRAKEGDRKQGVGIVPVISLGRTREEAISKVNIPGLLEEARERPAWQKAGPFDNADSLEGILVAGTAQDVAERLEAFAQRGVDQLVLDFRLRMDSYEDSLHQIAEDVLPLISRR